jgi:hypothetical protein
LDIKESSTGQQIDGNKFHQNCFASFQRPPLDAAGAGAGNYMARITD